VSPQKQSQKAKTQAPQSKAWIRIVIFVVVILFAFGGVLAIVVGGGDSSTDVKAGDTTSSTAAVPAAGSAAGKPCVAVADTPPAGAPEVPVQVGAPPKTLVTQDLEPGTGTTVAEGATVTVDYIGVSCSTGKIFDSSYSRGEPATFSLSQVIPGWGQGIPGMKVGGTRLLGIPPDLAYGDQSQGADIAPGETLWFVVKVENTQ
jgi:peptidylprolyl isomerase